MDLLTLASVAVDLEPRQFSLARGKLRVSAPPALTPLLKRFESSYIGVWRHPPVAGRTVSFVEYSWETSRAREIARTTDQLVAWLFVVLLETVDDPTVDRRWGELAAASASLGLADLAEFYDLTLDGTDSLYALRAFAQRPPRDAALGPRPGYDGEFPRLDDPSSARRAAGCEVPVDAPAAWLELARAHAPWIAAESPDSVFSDLVSAGDVESAWLALNSPGWPVDRAADALGQLAAATNVDGLRPLVDDWLADTDRRTGGY